MLDNVLLSLEQRIDALEVSGVNEMQDLAFLRCGLEDFSFNEKIPVEYKCSQHISKERIHVIFELHRWK